MLHQNESALCDISRIQVPERLVKSDPYTNRKLQRQPSGNTLRLQPPSFSLDRRSGESLCSSDQDLNQDSEGQNTNRFKMKESSVSLRRTMNHMRKDGKMTDFVIKAKTYSIPCHKLILGAQAKYFELMFDHEDTSECDFSEMFDSKVLQVVIDYFYTGKITFEYDDVIPVVQVLDYLQVNDDILKDAIFDYVENNLNDTLHSRNCVKWFMFGDQMNKPEIKRVSYNMMMKEYQRIFKGSDVLMLNFDQFTTFLRDIIRKFYARQYRDPLLKVSSRWINFDGEARHNRFADITAIIDLDRCSKWKRKKYCSCVDITPSPLIASNPASSPSGDNSESSLSADNIASSPSGDNTESSPSNDNSASSLSTDKIASSLSGDTTASPLKTDSTASYSSADNTASSLSTDNTASSLSATTIASSLQTDNTASSPSADNTASSPSGDNTASSPSADNAATRVPKVFICSFVKEIVWIVY